MMGGFNMKLLWLATFLVHELIALPVHAQEMRPIVENMKETRLSYQLTRCAGLYNAFAMRIGTERMKGGEYKHIDDASLMFTRLTALSLVTEGVTSDPKLASEMALRDVKMAMELYVQRFHDNYARTGQAFSDDELIDSDFAICRAYMGSEAD